MYTSETLGTLVGDVVFVLLGEARPEPRSRESSNPGMVTNLGKHRTPPPWHHHNLHTDIKGSASSRGETVSPIVLRCFVRIFYEGSLTCFANTIANTHDATRSAGRRFDVTNHGTGLDLVNGRARKEMVGIFKLITMFICMPYLHY
jgi:hypothetical protein